MALTSKSSMNRLATIGLMGVPWLFPDLVHNTYPETRSRCSRGRTPAGQQYFGTDMDALLRSSVFCSNLFLMVLIVQSIVTDINSALIS